MNVRHPAIPLGTLRSRYAALGPLEEHAGERTIVSRCLTFEAMLKNGETCATLLREEMASREDMRAGGGEDAWWPPPILDSASWC